MNKLNHSIEKETPLYDEHQLVDSHIITTADNHQVKKDLANLLGLPIEEDSTNNFPLPPPDPPDLIFPEQHWKFAHGKWLPPENPNPSTVHKLQSSFRGKTENQSDSGANRIVTDNLNTLLDVQQIDPTPMSGCNSKATTTTTPTIL